MKINDIERWRVEINLSEQFREDQFGKMTSKEKTLAGENIDYYEKGFSDRVEDTDDLWLTTLNVVDAIVSIIVPSLYFKNPRTVTTPLRIESEDGAPIAGKTIDHYRKKLEAEEINQKIIFDAYVLGYGVYKIGYTTKFGKDIEDETKKPKSMMDKGLESLGLKKKEEKEVIRPESDLRIIAESPFLEYISPFDFLLDPRATSLNDAMWWGHRLRKTVKSMKDNKKYKNTANLKGTPPEIRTFDYNNLSIDGQEAFDTIDLYEIHYRNENDFYILVISKDENGWGEHYHEKSIYEMGEWQCDMLTFKKHAHYLYPRSDITKIKNLQDRITSTIDTILDQVDRFVPKIAYNEGDLTPEGENALQNGGVGAAVKCTRNPNEVFKELMFTQLKSDLQALLDQLVTLITIQTGITRAQLTGVSASNTATEAQIEQGGQNLRLSDMSGSVQRFVNHQSVKLWKVIKQFVDLEELQLINGIKGIDQETGSPKYDWLTINPGMSERLQEGEYDFDIEVGSTQKIDLSVVRKSFENLFNILARGEVIGLMQQQGDKVALAEMLRKYLDLFPELAVDSGKIIQKITQGTQGLIPPEQGPGGMTSGSQNNALEKMRGAPTPVVPQQISEGMQI